MNSTPNKIRTIFVGTPDFAVPSLRALIEDKLFDIVAVVTQPDKKVGRKQAITPPPVKVEALKYNLKVWQPNQISNFQFPISKIDLIIVIAYAQILPEYILNLPKYGCINIHASLLPRYRGASPIQAAILNGDKETGITIMKMDKGLDTGPILAQKSIEISDNDTAGTLYGKLAGLGAEILAPAIKEYISGKIVPQKQDNSIASYTGLLKKEDGKIDWKKTATLLEKFIRAMNPWPSAFTEVRSKKLEVRSIKILEVEHEPLKINKYEVGEIFLYNNKLAVQCGQDSLVVKKLQLEGKKAMTSDEFLRGNKELIGQTLT